MINRFILLTSSGEGNSVAYRAQREGLDTITGVFGDWNETYTPEEAKEDNSPEEPLEKELRLKNFNGMVKQTSPEKILKVLAKLSGTEKQQTYVFIDMNYNFKYSEELLSLNVPGNYPQLSDRILESDREAGKNFVKEHYTDLKLTEVHDYNSAQDALEFLEENMGNGDQAKLYVLKGNDAGAETIVPLNNDTPQQAYETIKTALEKDASVYEGKGFLLEEFIKDAIEITPQVIFYNGTPVYYSVDIEIKKKGSGLSGRTSGCAANLVFRTKPEDEINKIAFPQIVYQMAKERQGIFIWDASVLCNPETGEYYMGEFCSNRWGWDCAVTEFELAGGVAKFFNAVMSGDAPYDYDKFGFGVRIYNELDDSDNPKHAAAGIPFTMDQQVVDHVWPMYVFQDDEGMKSSGYGEDLAVVTCAADTIEAAAEGCYEYMDKIGFKDYSRLSIDDVLSTRAAGTILNRYHYGIKQGLYDGPKVDNYAPVSSQNDIMKAEPMQEPSQSMQEYKEAPSNMKGMLEMITAVVNENEGLKRMMGEKIKNLEQDYQKKLTEALEVLRNELTVKMSNPVKQARENKEVATALQMVGSTLQELKNSLSSLVPQAIDLTGVQQALALLPGKSEALEQAKYLIKISDSFLDLQGGFASLEKTIREKKDLGYTFVVKAIAELQKHFTKEIDKLAKSNEKIIVTSGGNGGGKGNISGIIQVSYDYVALSNYSGNNPQTIQFYQGGSAGRIVGKLTITYDGSGNILTVTKVF